MYACTSVYIATIFASVFVSTSLFAGCICTHVHAPIYIETYKTYIATNIRIIVYIYISMNVFYVDYGLPDLGWRCWCYSGPNWTRHWPCLQCVARASSLLAAGLLTEVSWCPWATRTSREYREQICSLVGILADRVSSRICVLGWYIHYFMWW